MAHCLVTTYMRDIFICKLYPDNTFSYGSLGGLHPTHEWLHDMDSDTYSQPFPEENHPHCRDTMCVNY